ncbi:MAG: cellulase family glycosylhydrolase [Sedimentisphaerales bacterium]
MKGKKTRRAIVFLSAMLILSCAQQVSSKPLAPNEAVRQMGRGINMGNTLEPPREGDWNNGPAQEYYFDDYKKAGFTCVRIPVRWDLHTDTNAPYKVDEPG